MNPGQMCRYEFSRTASFHGYDPDRCSNIGCLRPAIFAGTTEEQNNVILDVIAPWTAIQGNKFVIKLNYTT